ncbi:MAG: PHP domain-containing protein [bacterium]
MGQYADLHIHTTASDGTITPEETVELALQAGLKAIAITDHDAVEGIAPANEAARGRGLEVVPGVELSVSVDGIDLHLLGYYIDHTNGPFVERLQLFRRVREERAEKIVEKLNRLGVPLNLEKVKEIAGEGAIGRPHIAEALLQEHVVASFNEAFTRFLGYHGPAYVPKFKISPGEGIEMIRSVGGIAVFAHPGTVRKDELIPEFMAQGLQGLEVIHPEHNQTLAQHYTNLARKYGLVTTGGSDSHGPRKNLPAIGGIKIPWAWVAELRELWKES